MPAIARRPLSALIVFCSLACLSLPANANSVSVSGTAYGGSDTNGLSVTAGIFSTWSAAPFGYSQVGGGTAGVPMTLSFSVLPWPGPDNATVNIGSKFTDILQGAGILFTGTFTVPFSALAKGTFTAPISFTGQLLAYQDLTLGQGFYTQGPLMASLTFKGTGTVTFQLMDLGNGGFIISYGSFTFNGKGNLTVVPEPASLFLMGTGLAALGGVVRRRVLFRQSA
jgi:PEP-CTERM motif-containing protein